MSQHQQTPVRAFAQIRQTPPTPLARFAVIWMLAGLGPGPMGAYPDREYAAWLHGPAAQWWRDYLATHR